MQKIKSATAGPYPVIIMGMHRSGTSLVAELLERLGLFIGKHQEENNEAVFFAGLNDWLLRQAGAAWDNPQPVQYLIESPHAKELAVNYLCTLMRLPLAPSYLGITGILKYRSIFNLSIPWGWKDPRNTFTLPLWLELFPQARVICLKRHGIDVAMSLKMRCEKNSMRAYGNHHSALCMPHLWRQSKRLFSESARCESVEGGLSLWDEYNTMAAEHVGNLGDRALLVSYEDMLLNPATIIRDIAGFCGLQSTDRALNQAASLVKPGRAFAHKKDNVSGELQSLHSETLKKFGY